jgi:glycosyltransferase involved in cell wall biosynthesis
MGPTTPTTVCFVSLQARGAFLPVSGAKIGGAETQIRRLAVALAADPAFSIHVIVEDSGQAEREEVDGVTLWRLAQPPEKPSATGRAWRRLVSGMSLRRLARRIRADVYVQRSAGAETGLVERAAHAVGGRFIYMMANDWELERPWSAGGGLSALLFRRGLRRADAIVAQHSGQREELLRVFGLQSETIPSLYDFPDQPPPAGDAVLWIGRCVRQKHPERLLELARRLPDARFIMVAPRAAQEADVFERTKRDAASLANLLFIPGATPAELEAIYPRGAVLVNTSDREGMPNVLIEAAAHGLALAALSIDPEGMFTRHGAGIVAGGDLDRLAGRIEPLLDDPALLAELAGRAFDWMRVRHSPPSVLPRLKQLLTGKSETPGHRE